MAQLTVAIPTYNRASALSETVRQLLPQLTPDCKLLIVDNASEMPASDVLGPLLLTRPDVNVQLHRNRYNLGMCGNFMRCFELCDTEWLWMLSDDDSPATDAITKILRQLDSSPDCVFHNFVCPTMQKENRMAPRTTVTETSGVEEFLAALDHFAILTPISLNVYRVPEFVRHFSVGVDYAYSLLNFIAMILVVLGESGRASFTPEVLIPEIAGVKAGRSWSRIRLALVGCALLDLPLTPTVRRSLAKKIPTTFLRLKTNATILLDDLRSGTRSAEEVRYFFHQICARAYYFDRSIARRIQIAVYKLLFRFPGLSTPLRRTPVIKKMLFNEKRKVIVAQ